MEVSQLSSASPTLHNGSARPRTGEGAMKQLPEPQSVELLERRYRDQINSRYGATIAEIQGRFHRVV